MVLCAMWLRSGVTINGHVCYAVCYSFEDFHLFEIPKFPSPRRPCCTMGDSAVATQGGASKSILEMSWAEVIMEVNAEYTEDSEGHKSVAAFLMSCVRAYILC